jgi:hypothetical protein
MPGKQVPLRRVNPRCSGRVRYAGFVAGLQGTVLPMELPGGLATIDPRHPAQCQSTLRFGFKRRAHRIPHRRPGNGRRAEFLRQDQAESGGYSAISWTLAKNP